MLCQRLQSRVQSSSQRRYINLVLPSFLFCNGSFQSFMSFSCTSTSTLHYRLSRSRANVHSFYAWVNAVLGVYLLDGEGRWLLFVLYSIFNLVKGGIYLKNTSLSPFLFYLFCWTIFLFLGRPSLFVYMLPTYMLYDFHVSPTLPTYPLRSPRILHFHIPHRFSPGPIKTTLLLIPSPLITVFLNHLLRYFKIRHQDWTALTTVNIILSTAFQFVQMAPLLWCA